MKREVGLWIDHTKAIIVTITGKKEEIRQVRSNVEKYVRFSGGSYGSPLYGTSNIIGIGKQDREFMNFLNSYYEGIVLKIHHADSIWIFGPGEAKRELEKHLQRDPFKANIIAVETVDKMTDHQIIAKVSRRYQKITKNEENDPQVLL